MILNQKIKQILAEMKFTPSFFADEIGVQRSSISHILSGRNKPSFEIIQKIVKRFPELGYEWLMDDTNTVPMPFRSENEDGYVEYKNAMIADKSTKNFSAKTQSFLFNTEMGGKTVQKVMVFYTDNSFSEYSPS